MHICILCLIWFSPQIKKINTNIIKVEKKASIFRLSRLLVIKDTFDGHVVEKERLVANIIRGMKKERESNGSYPVGKNDDEAGPSSTKGGALDNVL